MIAHSERDLKHSHLQQQLMKVGKRNANFETSNPVTRAASEELLDQPSDQDIDRYLNSMINEHKSTKMRTYLRHKIHENSRE